MTDPKLNLPLKLEADRVESADYVLWALETHGETLVDRLESRSPTVDKTPPETGGATAARVMVGWYQERTTRVRSLLLRQCRTYRAAKTERTACWRHLRDTARTVGTAVAGIRDQFFSTYGEDFSVRLGFARQTPRRHVELLEYVGYLVECLARPATEMPEPAPGRLPIDVAEQLALLEPLHLALEDARNAYHVARREGQAALAARNEAVEAFDAEFPWLAGGFENLLRMADLKPLAAAVRPSSRRKGLIALVAGEATGPEESTGEEPSSQPDEEALSVEPAVRPDSDEGISEEPRDAASDALDTKLLGAMPLVKEPTPPGPKGADQIRRDFDRRVHQDRAGVRVPSVAGHSGSEPGMIRPQDIHDLSQTPMGKDPCQANETSSPL